MDCTDVRSQLSAFIDDELSTERRTELDAHLETCAACAGIARDVQRIRDTARRLGPIDPPAHLWLEIAGQLHHERTPPKPLAAPTTSGRRSPAWQWIGLAAALVLVTLSVYLVRHMSGPSQLSGGTVASGGNASAPPSVEAFQEELKQAEMHYQKAITELEAITKANNGSMDPAIAEAVQKNLVTIDRAITDSRTALNANPDSEPARDSLFEALRRKVGVLQATVALMNEMRKGDQENAARAAARLGRKS